MLNLSTIAISLKNRSQLKDLFKNKSRLSETHFADLIDSTLNKQEDKFHGVWQEERTYSPGDVVYYQGVLWEVQASKEICAKATEPPGTGSNWKSYVKELEQKVNKLEKNFTTLNTAFTEYQQQMEIRLDKLLKYITLLSLGVAFALLWLVIESIHYLFSFAA